MDLKEIFDEVSNQMKSDFVKAQKSLTHAGLKGEANEETVRKFLRQYLPKTLDITTGMLVDSDGSQSRQLDIIICDSVKTPIFYQSGLICSFPSARDRKETFKLKYLTWEVSIFVDLELYYKQSLRAYRQSPDG